MKVYPGLDIDKLREVNPNLRIMLRGDHIVFWPKPPTLKRNCLTCKHMGHGYCDTVRGVLMHKAVLDDLKCLTAITVCEGYERK